MPAVPKRKISKRRGASRRSMSWGLKPKQQFVICPNCGAATRPHHVCPSCGLYRGEKVVEIKEE
ncbi:MAG: 50S ribosomal protein L32 [Anaerolineales bacterium]|nr:50S ribosomal protein L32 [Anaerolineales bacterium]